MLPRGLWANAGDAACGALPGRGLCSQTCISSLGFGGFGSRLQESAQYRCVVLNVPSTMLFNLITFLPFDHFVVDEFNFSVTNFEHCKMQFSMLIRRDFTHFLFFS